MRRYPRQTAIVVGLLFLGGFAEGIGIAALLPLLEVQIGGSTEPTAATRWVSNLLSFVGLAPTLGTLLVTVVLGVVVKNVLTKVGMIRAGYAKSEVAADLRLDLIHALMEARWGLFTRQPLGVLANSVSSEAKAASAFYSLSADMMATAFQVVIYVTLAVLVAGYATIGALAFSAVMVVALSSLIGMAREAGKRQTHVLRDLISRLTDVLGAIKAVKAMGREQGLLPILEGQVRSLLQAERRYVLSAQILGGVHEPIITAFLAVGIYVFLTRFDVNFEALIFVVFLFHRTVTRLAGLQVQYQKLTAPEAAYLSITQTLRQAQAAREVDGGTVQAPELKRSVRLENVSFAYDGSPVLQGCSIEVPAGVITAIIGSSGSGKTTIADLILGLYRPESGEIWIDDVPMSDVDLRSWRSRIGYVPQDPVLFNDTILANVVLEDPGLTADDAERALRAAEAWEFVSELPEGIRTYVGERGAALSGGQRQRIAIARALAAAPDLLVLDEATTALDPATERSILETLERLRGRITILAISHQPAIMNVADQVIRLGAAGHPLASAES